MSSKSFRQYGFTIIEMLVVTFIIGMIAALAIVNFRQGNRAEALRVSTTKIATVIREAQNLAMTGVTRGIASSTAPSYGVHFDTNKANQFILFVDKDSNGQYETANDLTIATHNLLRGITISNLSLSPYGGDVNVLDIVFYPPKPIIKFNGAADDSSAIIELIQEKTGKTREVTVNRISGQISS